MKNCWRRRGSSSKIQKITLKRKNTGEKFNIQLESGDSFNVTRTQKIDHSLIKNYTKKLLTRKDWKIEKITSKKRRIKIHKKNLIHVMFKNSSFPFFPIILIRIYSTRRRKFVKKRKRIFHSFLCFI